MIIINNMNIIRRTMIIINNAHSQILKLPRTKPSNQARSQAGSQPRRKPASHQTTNQPATHQTHQVSKPLSIRASMVPCHGLIRVSMLERSFHVAKS